MAELLPDDGSVVPARRAAGHRALLPFEVALCETLGINAEEYLHFQALSDAYNGTRPKEYELAGVPDVRNDPVSIVVNLVIGLALSAIASLLAPKPAKAKTPPQLKTADKTGAKRFAQTEGFSSIQEPAVLGQTIPVVFAKRTSTTGGVRVNAMLLWSQLLSRGTGQQLKAAMLLSAGHLGARPDYEGLAIGDQTLKNYTSSKLGVYYRPAGGRLTESDRYPQSTIAADPLPWDILRIFANASGGWQPWFSSTRTPSTQTQFGCYSPLPNGNAYRVPYELVMTGKDAENQQRQADNAKKRKIKTDFSIRAGIHWADAEWIQPGQTCSYAILGDKENNRFDPWGLDDVNAATEEARAAADQQIQVGDIYMAGDAMLVCTGRSKEEPWELGSRRLFSFRCIEAGRLDRCDPNGNLNKTYSRVLQRLAVATVANSRDCDITELGIKSMVWRQINGFPNVNSEPSDDTIRSYERKNGSITLGALNRYNKRRSYFRLEWRVLGSAGGWRDLSAGRIFYVEGRTPIAQYNFIRVEHPRGQYEFRLKPVPGSTVFANWRGQTVFELGPMGLHQYWQDGLSVSFAGRPRNTNDDDLTNPDWYLKGESGTWVEDEVWAWRPESARYKFQSDCTFSYRDKAGTPSVYTYARWDNKDVKLGAEFTVKGTRYRYGRGAARETRRAAVNSVYTPKDPSVIYEITRERYSMQLVRRFVPSACLNPFDVVGDYKIYDAENASHFDGPEHEVVYVNEQLSQAPAQYDELSYMGLRINSTKEWSSFEQLSAYIKRGVMIERLIDDAGNPVAEGAYYDASNNLAEIAYTLLVDRRLGAGAMVGRKAVNRERMQQAARWCHANGFTWDGVLGESLNLREWIFEQAGYALLDFTILGGQFSLVPSFPHNAAYAIDRYALPKISALFTDGNIRELKVAWLGPEERQLFKAVVSWRQEAENGFSRKRVLAIRLADALGGSDRDPEEDFDLSAFCTTAAQARTFARVALKLRKEVRHGLSFQTTPQSAMGLVPGAYFRLVSEVTHTSRFSNGTIDAEGRINTAEKMADGQHRVIYWEPGTEGVKEATITVRDGACSEAALWGTVFTVANSTTTSRVYKVETIAYASEGWVTVTGSHQPLTQSGSLAVLDWQDSHFIEEGM